MLVISGVSFGVPFAREGFVSPVFMDLIIKNAVDEAPSARKVPQL